MALCTFLNFSLNNRNSLFSSPEEGGVQEKVIFAYFISVLYLRGRGSKMTKICLRNVWIVGPQFTHEHIFAKVEIHAVCLFFFKSFLMDNLLLHVLLVFDFIRITFHYTLWSYWLSSFQARGYKIRNIFA